MNNLVDLNVASLFWRNKQGLVEGTRNIRIEDYQDIDDQRYKYAGNNRPMSLSPAIAKTLGLSALGKVISIGITDRDTLYIEALSNSSSKVYGIETDMNNKIIHHVCQVYKNQSSSNGVMCYHTVFPFMIAKLLNDGEFNDAFQNLMKDIDTPQLFCKIADSIYFFAKDEYEANEYKLNPEEPKDVKIVEDYTPRIFGNDGEFKNAEVSLQPFPKSSFGKQKSQKTKTTTTKTNEKIFKVKELDYDVPDEYKDLIPKEDPGMILGLDEADIKMIRYSLKKNKVIMLVGPTATGKTTLVEKICYDNQIPYHDVPCTDGTEVEDYLGSVRIESGNTYFQEGSITRAVQAGGIICLDEINFARPAVLNAIHPMSDNRKEVHVPEYSRPIKAHDKTRLFATMNVGDIYFGTNDLNQATRRRFPITVEMDYLDRDIEKELLMEKTKINNAKLADSVVKILNRCRQAQKSGELTKPADTATGIEWFEAANEVGIKKAAEYTILPMIAENDEEERKIVKEFIDLVVG